MRTSPPHPKHFIPPTRLWASCCPELTKPTVGSVLPIKTASNIALKRMACLGAADSQVGDVGWGGGIVGNAFGTDRYQSGKLEVFPPTS
ncbi:hypothetical protein V496_04456 [Pseudogymnoascus sp. VKM F-4515 (FW-2607)]|nr:hypothetical protein V496_04456 [Pseudogymnoascus sp. VKM F-4515 (FW-2607)]